MVNSTLYEQIIFLYLVWVLHILNKIIPLSHRNTVMNTKTLHINKPSERLLSFVKTLKENKERTKKELLSKKKQYFKQYRLMAVDIVIPYTSTVGSQFLINFKEFESQEDFSISVIDVSLILVEAKEQAIGMKDLIAISRIIRDFLNENKVVLYYYCDHSSDDIFISERHVDMPPQKFRSNLFSSIFNFIDVSYFVKDQIIIGDEDSNDAHYISLITKEEDKSGITEISIKVQEMNDK